MPRTLAPLRPATARLVTSATLATLLLVPSLGTPSSAATAGAPSAPRLSAASDEVRGTVPSYGLAKVAGAGRLDAAGYGTGMCHTCRHHNVNNWSRTPPWVTGLDAQGRIVTARITDRSVVVNRHVSASAPARGRRTLSVPKGWDVGGFHVGSDGHFYLAAGRTKASESRSRPSIQVRRYSPALRLLNTISVPGRVAETHLAFRHGNGAMTLHQGSLWLAVPQTEFSGGDGVNHQAAHLLRFDFARGSVEHVNRLSSHSFGQFIASDGSRLVTAEHGDAYPRAITVAQHREEHADGSALWTQDENGQWTSQDRWWTEDRVDVLKISGREGDNFTGATLNGLALTPDATLTTGLSQPQKVGLKGVKGNRWSWKPNVWVAVGDPTTEATSFRWITTAHPKRADTAFGQPRLTQVAEDRFALLYASRAKGRGDRTHYVLLDSKGRTLRTKTFAGEFAALAEPVLHGDRLIWINQFSSKSDPSRTTGVRLAALDVRKPEAPKRIRR